MPRKTQTAGARRDGVRSAAKVQSHELPPELQAADPPEREIPDVEIDETRMQERPEHVSEKQWRARLTYEAIQHQQASDPDWPTTETDTTAARAADQVRRAGG